MLNICRSNNHVIEPPTSYVEKVLIQKMISKRANFKKRTRKRIIVKREIKVYYTPIGKKKTLLVTKIEKKFFKWLMEA